MPRSRWDDQWWRRRDTPSTPLPAEGGIASSKQRGPMAETWWSRRFVEVLESYGLGGRMQRGRRYARIGQVLSLEVGAGLIAARVQGSRPAPYVVKVSLPLPSAEQWATVESAMSMKVGFVARLLAGEVPGDLEEVFAAAGVALFPTSWGEVKAACSCPDWGNPCKHIAAVLYLFADLLDGDPWLLLAWRGREREEILSALPGAGRGGGAGPGVVPWWPFPAGPMPEGATAGRPAAAQAVVPDQPDAVLEGLAPLDASIGKAPFVELLRPVYRWIVEGP